MADPTVHAAAAARKDPAVYGLQERPTATVKRDSEPHSRSRVRREAITPWLFLAPALIYIVLFFAYPLIANTVMSLREYTQSTFFTGEAPFVGAENYGTIFSDPGFWAAMRHTAVFTFFSVVFQYILGLGLALYFHQKFPFAATMRSLILVPFLLPAVVTGTVFRWILDQDFGVFNRLLSMLPGLEGGVGWLSDPSVALISVTAVNVWAGLPLCMVLLYAGLQGIREELYEAAALDGAGVFKRFWYITLPQLRPVSSVVLLLTLIYTIRAFDIVQTLTQGGPANSTQVLSTWSYLLSFGRHSFGQGAAVANVLVLVAMVFALIYIRMGNSESRKEART